MENKYYSVEEISSMLKMHAKTVQRYIREGKIKAVKVGKAWRVSERDFQAYFNTYANLEVEETVINQDPNNKIMISSVIDIDVPNMADAMNIANGITASMNSKPAEFGKSSLNVQFLESENKLRLMIWGNIKFTKAIMSMLEGCVDKI